MTLQELRTGQREQILSFAGRSGARNVRVFGSVACGDSDERSDIDFLVDLEPGRSLFGVDLDAVWVVVERDLPVLKSLVQGILRDADPASESGSS
jgi:uncharacterized protein